MKKTLLAPALFTAFLAAALPGAAPARAETALAADSFVDSVGVTIHMSYTNTPYFTQWPQVLAALKELGIRHYRDGFFPWDPAKVPYYKWHQQLLAAGLKGDIIVPWNPKTTAAQVVQFCQLATDCEVLEDPNEINASRMPDWVTRLKFMLPIISDAAQQLGVPVYGPSFTNARAYTETGDVASAMTYNNLHIYFGGRFPGSHGWGPKGYGSIDYWKQLGEIDGAGKPDVVTETGYMTQAGKPYDVPEDFQTMYMLRTLMEMQNAGMARTYIYEFIDERSSPDYGIMHADLTPKPAYTALKNVLALLVDKGAPFTPGALNYKLTGAAPNVHHLLMEKRDGTFYLALWVEDSGYDTALTKLTPIAAQSVTLSLAGGAVGSNLIQVNNADGTLITKPLVKAANIPLQVTDSLSFVQITGPAAALAKPQTSPRAPKH